MVILPVTHKQFSNIDSDNIDKTRKPVRFMADGHNVNVCMGTCLPKGTNVIYQFVYWDRPKSWIDSVLAALKTNNPGVKFTTISSS